MVRDSGVIPATIGVINGKICVGMNANEMALIAENSIQSDKKMNNSKKLIKISRRDLPIAVSQKLSGGTTVSATSLISHLCGIKMFATGGIGGVHRNAELTLDISADLTELNRTPITIVSAGIKSILDIEKTLEVLETQGVCVSVFNGEEDPNGEVEFPAFFTRRSGCKVSHNLRDPMDAAKMIRAREELFMESGILIAVPIPAEHEAVGQIVNNAIDQALNDAKYC